MQDDMSLEFKEDKKENKTRNYVIVGILYAIVIILSVILYLGLKHQKQVVKNNLDKADDSAIKDLYPLDESGLDNYE